MSGERWVVVSGFGDQSLSFSLSCQNVEWDQNNKFNLFINGKLLYWTINFIIKLKWEMWIASARRPLILIEHLMWFIWLKPFFFITIINLLNIFLVWNQYNYFGRIMTEWFMVGRMLHPIDRAANSCFHLYLFFLLIKWHWKITCLLSNQTLFTQISVDFCCNFVRSVASARLCCHAPRGWFN